MKARIIACEVFYRELSLALAESEHVLDARFIPFGLHDTPSELRARLQEEIDEAEGQGYDYLILGYGLCSRGTADLRAGSVPIVIPRAHDCITLFLGSRAAYNNEFLGHPGTYYYSPGWIERKSGEVRQGFVEEAKEAAKKDRFQEYCEKYGRENAEYLVEQESLWLQNYTRAAYIHMGLGPADRFREYVRGVAASHGWNYEEIAGDMTLIRRLVSGNWDDDFLVVPPGASIEESFDEDIVRSRQCG